MKVAVFYNEPLQGKTDSEDVLEEAGFVMAACASLGHEALKYGVRGGADGLAAALELLRSYRPDVVFNLVETLDEDPRGHPGIAALIEMAGFPHTGAPYDALMKGTDKVLTKAVLAAHAIPTAPWVEYRGGDVMEIDVQLPVIVKPAWEDASVGIDDSSVYHDIHMLRADLPVRFKRHGGQSLIIERYIDGREFNISIIEGPDGRPVTMPLAEIIFNAWPADKPRIVNYKAKWESTAFEYENTFRTFTPAPAPFDVIRDTAVRSWDAFGMRGYARVDMRVDAEGIPWVIEVNSNPCITPEAGFLSAMAEGGYTHGQVVGAILEAALRAFRK